KQDRIAADRRIKDPDVSESFKGEQKRCYSNDRCAQNHHETDSIMGPHEKRQPEPCHTGCAHRVDSDYEVQPRKNGRETIDEYRQANCHNVSIRKRRAVRNVKRPTGIYTTLQQGPYREQTGSPVNVETEQVDSRQCEILC